MKLLQPLSGCCSYSFSFIAYYYYYWLLNFQQNICFFVILHIWVKIYTDENHIN